MFAYIIVHRDAVGHILQNRLQKCLTLLNNGQSKSHSALMGVAV